MAETDSSQEKTEEPTGRKIQKAREEGQIPRSKELGTMAVLMSAAVAFLIFGPALGRSLENILRYSFSMTRDEIFDPGKPIIHLGAMAIEAATALIPFMLILLIASIFGNIALGGMLVSGKSIMPKFSRINPLEGLKRMFSLKSLMELVKAIAKTLVVGGVGWLILNNAIPSLLDMTGQDPMVSIRHTLELMAWSFLFLSSSLILIAMVDIPFQIYDHTKNLRMTKQEIKDEFKDTEGKPEVKRRVRELQYQMTQRRMLQEVPKADVVITNPTHYSVALKYDAKTMDAPVVVAKGVDHMAMKIREIARAHDVELVETPPLTRAIYYHADIDEEIPSGLYLAVAQVLAYVFQLRRFRRGFGKRPGKIPDFDIPSHLRRDS
ncbi:flagellar biosynthesis protein FlhB [Hahella sp. CCB-MM4]|uniref:flagellar biosynthesis protein FlhB n=1 Tax=Hahella sp. (strain CCB-MM4) TaxID=1926491 RepID=UPI000B9A6D29|nr:flagellar biosynthesis protein FlhB [Hahella sp. CCB-MM4]OZG72877.1 flagellar biosynthesis protein FlhB [Hahella sp. CCB-MM4]